MNFDLNNLDDNLNDRAFNVTIFIKNQVVKEYTQIFLS